MNRNKNKRIERLKADSCTLPLQKQFPTIDQRFQRLSPLCILTKELFENNSGTKISLQHGTEPSVSDATKIPLFLRKKECSRQLLHFGIQSAQSGLSIGHA